MEKEKAQGSLELSLLYQCFDFLCLFNSFAASDFCFFVEQGLCNVRAALLILEFLCLVMVSPLSEKLKEYICSLLLEFII